MAASVASAAPCTRIKCSATTPRLWPLDDTSDRNHTGEQMGAGDERVRADRDIGTDRVVGPDEAGLGDGLDEAEEAWAEHDRGEH